MNIPATAREPSPFHLVAHCLQRPQPFVKTADFLLFLSLSKNLPSTARCHLDPVTTARSRTTVFGTQLLTKNCAREGHNYQVKGGMWRTLTCTEQRQLTIKCRAHMINCRDFS